MAIPRLQFMDTARPRRPFSNAQIQAEMAASSSFGLHSLASPEGASQLEAISRRQPPTMTGTLASSEKERRLPDLADASDGVTLPAKSSGAAAASPLALSKFPSSKLDPNSKPFSPRRPYDVNANVDLSSVGAKMHLQALSPSPLALRPGDVYPGYVLRAATSRDDDDDDDDDDGTADDLGLQSLTKVMRAQMMNMDVIRLEKSFVDKALAARPDGAVHSLMESPFSERLVGVLHDWHAAPGEYTCLSERLSRPLGAPQNIADLPTEIVLLLFYLFVQDRIQIVAAEVLHSRGWRFSMSKQVWLSRPRDSKPYFKSDQLEVGDYQIFNTLTWKRSVERMTLYYEDLADRTALHPDLAHHFKLRPLPSGIKMPTLPM